MNRLALLTATTALAVPATAQAATGVVLSVDGHAHAVELVDGAHHLHAVHYRGRIAHLRPGARVRYAGSRLRVVGHGSASVTFVGRIVRSGRKGLVLQLANGHRVSFSSAQVHRTVVKHRSTKRARHHAADRTASAAGVTLNIVGLQPGETVVVTESIDGAGNVTLTITLPPPGTPSATGQTGGDDSGGDTSGGDSSPADPASQDLLGTIASVSGDGLTVTAADGSSHPFIVDDSSVTDGFSVGDQVDVTYQDLGAGSLDAIDVQWVQQDVSGTVSAVDSSHLTLTPDAGGQPVTFTADPADGTFDGVSVGDPVHVTYHVAGGQTAVDNVDDTAGD